MKKKSLKGLSVLFLFLFSFYLGIQNVKAEGEHKFSFRAYQCGTFDMLEGCLGPNGDYETPEIVIGTDKVKPGEIIKLAVYYEPGTDTFWNMSAFFSYNKDLVTPIHDPDTDSLILDKTGTAADPIYPGPFPAASARTPQVTNWIVQYNDIVASSVISSIIKDNSGSVNARKYLNTAGELYYVYFQVKDDATPGEFIDFTYDTSPGKTKIANDAPVTVENASIEIYEELSEDNTLSELSVSKGSTEYTLSPEFVPGSKEETSFTAVVPNSVSSVNIDAEPTDSNAVLTGDGEQNLTVGNNSFDLSVLSQAGETQIYTVNVYRLSNDADLSALTLSGIDYGTFNPNTTSYTKTVPYATSSTTVGATVHDTGKATASGTGNKDLEVGENTISVEVTPENCKSQYSEVPGNTCTKKTYTITVTREEASTVATLSDLKVDGTQVPNFDPETYEYNLADVANDKDSVNITYETTDSTATVTGDRDQDLAVGNNALEVVVTAEDGTTKKTYTINIKRKSNDNTLSSLTVTSDPAGTLSPSFDPTKTSYTYSVDANENEVTIAAEANNAGATVEGTGTYNPRTTNSVTITVTPEDGAAKEYTITFDRAKSTNADLSDLTVDGTQVSGFDKDTTTYNLTVDTTKESVTIIGTPADDKASISPDSEDGVQVLDFGLNEFEITVVAEDGTTTKDYTVKVTRPYRTDADLTDLKVDGTSVPNFDPDTTNYTLPDVENDKESVNITYVLSDSEGATIDGDGNQNLSVGDNALEVTVTAHDGTTTKTYTINIYRKSNDNTLKSMSVTASGEGTLDPDFASDKTSYTYYVGPDETEVVIAAEANQEGATVTGTGTYNPQNTSSVTITVTPESGTSKEYTITFDRAKSANANLSTITVDGTQVAGFDKDTTTYNLTVDTTKEKIDLDAILADDRASITTGDLGEKELGFGLNEFTIHVTAENNTTKKDYKVNITRPYRTDADLTDLKVDGTSVPNFDPDTITYNLPDVNNDKATVNIEYVLSDPDGAQIDGTGDQNLAVGDNELKVTVTAHDGTTTKTYTINIHRKSSDDTLKSLSVTSDPAGTLDKDFDPDITEYTYTADADETEIVIAAEANDEGATVTGTGTYNPRETNKVEIKVTSENGGEPKVYTINLELADSTNANLGSLSVTGYEIEPAFDPDITTGYTLTVPEDVEQIEVVATLEDDRGTINGDGPRDLDYGENEITVTGVAEDGVTEKPYTIIVTREKKSDATLSDLKVDGTTVPGFRADKYIYNLEDVATDKESVEIEYVTNDTDATATGEGTQPLSIGDNELKVVVTAHNGTTEQTYTINIHRKNDDKTLKSLTITSDPVGTLDKDFDPTKTNYTYTVDRDETEVVIEAEANGEGADVTGTGTYNPQTDTKAEILVTSENGSTNLYTITFEKAKKDNANLSSLEVEGYDLDKAFDPEITSYSLTVPNDVETINIIAEEADTGYATIDGDGTKDLTPGTKSYDVVVTADDGTTTKTYTITVTRELSDDVKLSEITVDGDPIEGFNPDEDTYTINVDKDTDSVVIDATAQDPDAEVNITGPDELQTGENEFKIEVVAPNGSKGEYTVIVNKAADDNDDLKSLEVEGYDLDQDFDPNITEYTLTVPSDVESVTVNAEADSDAATVEGTGEHALRPGENTITITVQAEDDTKEPKTYTITITKEQDDDEKITSVEYGHDIDETYILSGNLNAKGINMKNELDNDNSKLTITTPATRDDNGNITEEGEPISDDDYIATGYEVILKVNGVEKDRKIIVITGDVDGNGEITLLDGVTTCYHYLSISKNDNTKPRLTGAYLLAANLDENPEITLLDAVSIVYHYVGNQPIQYKTNYVRTVEGD